ncbi:MAG: sugar-binding domain-containing protein [Puniceicoccaceae bacterium]
MKQLILLIILLSQLSLILTAEERTSIDLSGDWAVQLDSDKSGETEQWWQQTFNDQLALPGMLTAQGYGDDVNADTPWVGNTRPEVYADPKYDPYKGTANFKWPFWLQPDKYYRGIAWYQKQVQIPAGWWDKRVVLHLERPHWETSVWVNGKKAGSDMSLSTPHVYDLTGLISAGRQKLTISVDNSINLNVGLNSHSISDHTQGNWNGIAGEMTLYATDLVWVDDVQVYPDYDDKSARVVVTIGNKTGRTVAGKVKLITKAAKSVVGEYRISGQSKLLELHLPLGNEFQAWDEFNPVLHDLQVALDGDSGEKDSLSVKFGIRKIATDGTQFTINGRPMFLRGTLECAIFPKTGHPAMDVAEWKRIIQECKDHGLNHMRFHSWCPPEAAFIAADELGFYFQVECASWANQGVTVGDGKAIDDWLYEEGERITKAYGNHPSFLLMAYGNEPGGKNQNAYLSKWCTYWKEKEPRALHTSGAGWPLLAESEFHNTHRQTRIQGWGEGLKSVINAKAPQTRFDFSEYLKNNPDKPTISHEIGQWCVYPNLEEIKKYTGPLKARNFEIFRDLLDNARMGDQAHDFLMASGKLQVLCYKHDIEASLRTRGFGGFQLLDLHDFPGQGTALVGVLDPFWEEKGYVTADEFNEFCAPTVPLARMDKMIWTSDETFAADVEIAHFGEQDISPTKIQWSLKVPGGDVIGSGKFTEVSLPTGSNTSIGLVSVPLGKVTKATKLVLQVAVANLDFENSWDVWCYPTKLDTSKPKGLHLATSLDETATGVLKAGGDVLLMISPEQVKTDVQLGFSSIFWNTAWTQGQPPHTLGILCDPAHPALGSFPTDFHSNWQWWELVTQAATMEMDGFPGELRPIVQVVPDWFAPKRLGLVFEANVGKGRLLVTSIDLQTDLANRPVARQLLSSLYQYASGPDFRPKEALTIGQISSALVK